MKSLEVKLSSKSYNILIKKGLIKDIGYQLTQIHRGKKAVVITDNNVDKIYSNDIRTSLENHGFSVDIIVVDAGETSKSLQWAAIIYNKFLDLEVGRRDLVIALGGGVIGDLAGFVASTYLRGVPFVQIPTTLLAQIDSSVGGKVALNLDRGKNLLGSFYHPEAVFIDTQFLRTLEDRYLYDGMAEVIKYGCIKDSELFTSLGQIHSKEELFDNIDHIVHRCCSIKRDIVEIDEREQGERMLLNFGHTIGHGIEKYFEYQRYTHGEAVAMGMYNITKKSEELGITQKGTNKAIKELLERFNLPYDIRGIDKYRLLDIIAFDKKREAEYLSIILLNSIGDSFIKKIRREDMTLFT